MADLRASDAEREAFVSQLRQHAGDGRLDVEELDARVDAAYHAKTRTELLALVDDLPPLERAPANVPPPRVTPSRSASRLPGRVRFIARWRARVQRERAMAEFLHHVAPPLYTLGYDVIGRSDDRIVFAQERRPLWIWPVMPFGFPFTLLLLFVKKRYTIVVDLASAGDETVLVAQGTADLAVRRAFARLEDGGDATYPARR